MRIFEIVVDVTPAESSLQASSTPDIHAYISYMNKALPLANTNSCAVQKWVHFQAYFSKGYEKRLPSNRGKME